jgi:hypothetical protein
MTDGARRFRVTATGGSDNVSQALTAAARDGRTLRPG